MNIFTTLKTLPLLAVLTVGLILSPTLSMAGNGEHGQHKAKYSQNAGKSHSKSHNKGNYRSNKHSYKTHGKRYKGNHSHRSERHHRKHDYYKRGHYDHRGHRHTNYIVKDHYYPEHFIGLDHLRFMIGLHTDILDITLHD